MSVLAASPAPFHTATFEVWSRDRTEMQLRNFEAEADLVSRAASPDEAATDVLQAVDSRR